MNANQKHDRDAPFDGVYINRAGFLALHDYKYIGEDLSLLANHVGQPFWRLAVHLLPHWVAPNLLTLLGLLGVLLSYLLLALHAPVFDLQPPHPDPALSLRYYLAALLLFIYQTLDALDGKQARRTATSSPLGELFDHGCDALTGTFLCLNLLTALYTPSASPTSLPLSPWLPFIGILSVVLPFYMVQWEEYHTGALVLGYVNVTEAQLVSIVVFALSGYYGPRVWAAPLFPGASGSFLQHVSGSTLIFATCAVGALWNMAVPCYKVTRFYLLSSSSSHASSSHHASSSAPSSFGLLRAYSHLGPLAVLTVASYLWISFSPSHILANHPHPLLITIGFLNSCLVGKVILARVCGCQPVSVLPLVLLPFCACTLLIVLWPLYFQPYEQLMLYGCTGMAVCAYLLFAYYVTRDMCRYLKINALTLTEAQLSTALRLVYPSNNTKTK